MEAWPHPARLSLASPSSHSCKGMNVFLHGRVVSTGGSIRTSYMWIRCMLYIFSSIFLLFLKWSMYPRLKHHLDIKGESSMFEFVLVF